MIRKPMTTLAALALVFAAAQAGAQAGNASRAPAPGPSAATAKADAMFKAWDADHNGQLSQTEFRNGVSSMRERAEAQTEARLQEQFEKVDANRNGAVDAGEYGNLLLVQRAGKSAPALATFDRNGDQRLQFDEYLALVSMLAVAPREAGKAP